MKNKLILLFMAGSIGAFAQSPMENGVLETKLISNDGTVNRSSVAFNPNQEIYYSVNAGATRYPIEAYDIDGKLLTSLRSAFDYRGAWWNPNTNRLEGNGFNDLGIWIHETGSKGLPISEGENDLPQTSGPDVQSNGDYDPINDEVLYYQSGSIYRHARKTNKLIESVQITGLPVSFEDINWNSIAYTGVPGMEAGIYDYVNKALYFINRETGEYVAKCQLPASAPSESAFRMGFANEQLFIFSSEDRTWYGYHVIKDCEVTTSNISVSVCDEYEAPSGAIYTETGIYEDVVKNEFGCDNILTIDLTITSESLDLGVQNIENQLIANQTDVQYQWINYTTDEAIEGATKQTFVPTKSGVYALEIRVDDCFYLSEPTTIKLLEVQDHTLSVFNVYPNPSERVVYVENPNQDVEVLSIELVSLTGELMQRADNPRTRTKFNIADYATGTYIVRILSNEGVQSKLVVKL